MHLLTTLTRSGRLYEIDVRLRPDGGKGLLVTSLEAYLAYQQDRAWTWEHQALVRARAVAGDVGLGRRFAEARAGLLRSDIDAPTLRKQIVDMRTRWRNERDRSDAHLLDLKQGLGALVDIEFLLQAIVLEHGARHPRLLACSSTPDLIDIAAGVGLFDDAETVALRAAHELLLARSLACTLDARPRVAARDVALDAACGDVVRIARKHGLALDTPVTA